MIACLWTGAEFPPVQRGPHAKVFASNAARAEAHKAARLYTERLIADGHLTWEKLRLWYDRKDRGPSYTATRQYLDVQPVLPMPELEGTSL